MTEIEVLDEVAIDVKSERLLGTLLDENPTLAAIMRSSRNETEALVGVRQWVAEALEMRPAAQAYYRNGHPNRRQFEALGWSDIAAIRILDTSITPVGRFPISISEVSPRTPIRSGSSGSPSRAAQVARDRTSSKTCSACSVSSPAAP